MYVWGCVCVCPCVRQTWRLTYDHAGLVRWLDAAPQQNFCRGWNQHGVDGEVASRRAPQVWVDDLLVCGRKVVPREHVRTKPMLLFDHTLAVEP